MSFCRCLDAADSQWGWCESGRYRDSTAIGREGRKELRIVAGHEEGTHRFSRRVEIRFQALEMSLGKVAVMSIAREDVCRDSNGGGPNSEPQILRESVLDLEYEVAMTSFFLPPEW